MTSGDLATASTFSGGRDGTTGDKAGGESLNETDGEVASAIGRTVGISLRTQTEQHLK